jgi:hypothetical protein
LELLVGRCLRAGRRRIGHPLRARPRRCVTLERPGAGKPKQKLVARDVHDDFLHIAPKSSKHFAPNARLAA